MTETLMPLLKGVRLFSPKIFKDERGKFAELYDSRSLPNLRFVEDDLSISRRNVLRGIHGDEWTWKLLSCLEGEVYCVVVNNDTASSEYRRWCDIEMKGEEHTQILIPPKFGLGYLIRSKSAVMLYKQTEHYGNVKQFTIQWNDPVFGVIWPVRNPILSERDAGR